MRDESADAWLDAAGRAPLLSPEQTIVLARKVQAWQQHPGPCPDHIKRRGIAARNKMVACNLRLVVHCEKKVRRGGEYLDRLQAGALGLTRAVEKFDPTRGYRLSTYAFAWIRQRITRLVEREPRASGVYVPLTAFGDDVQPETTAAAVVHTLVPVSLGDPINADGRTWAEEIPAEQSDPLRAAAWREALEACREADPDNMALAELRAGEEARLIDLGDLEGVGAGVIRRRIVATQQRLRGLPEVAAALAG